MPEPAPITLRATRAQLTERLERAHVERTQMSGTIGDLRRELADTQDELAEVRERAEQAEAWRDQLADDVRYLLGYDGPRHAHLKPGVWDDTLAPCTHCARLDQAREHLAALTPNQPTEET